MLVANKRFLNIFLTTAVILHISSNHYSFKKYILIINNINIYILFTTLSVIKNALWIVFIIHIRIL